jgi:4,5-dihydroxyphthalate decarboxylase
MTKLKVTLGCTQTDRSAPILDGRMQIEGCDVVPMPGQPQDIFRRVLEEQAFDIAEMSMSTHIVQSARGATDYVGIPVFLSRAFRHSSVYIRSDRGINRPEDLAGKIVGIEQYQQTVGLWVRGILADQHGVRTQDVRWRNGGLEQPGGGERLAINLPDGIELQAIPKDKTLNGLLVEGELDAVIATRPPSSFVANNPNVARLFPEYRRSETDYFKMSRCFPIMHGVLIRRSLVDENPWLPAEVFKTFVKAKAHALNELTMMNIARVSLAWVADDAADTRAVLGDQMWAYGLKESRHELEAMLRYSFNDGLIPRAIEPEALFHPSTYELPGN